MKHMRITQRILGPLVAGGLLAVSALPVEAADFTTSDGNWTFSVNGEINVDYIWSNCQSAASASRVDGGNTCVGSANGNSSVSNIGNGLLPASISFGIKTTQPGQAVVPAPSAGEGAPVDWFEVLGSSAESTQRFYAELFGWKVTDPGFPGYGMADTGAGRGIQGGLGSGDQASWATIYASVPDVEQVLARAGQLGGSRVYGPHQVDDHMQTGALRDPAGNVFGVYSHRAH